VSDEQQPAKRTATDAMRLRPAVRPGADPEVARERQAGAIDALEAQLAELVEALERLHSPLELDAGSLCRECLAPHPCRTVRLVHPDTEGATPREDSTQ
jgi:hypothetical protein